MRRLDQGSYRTTRGLRAPSLDILYKCPNKDCENEDVLDAYRGPPTCLGGRGALTHLPEFMVAQRMIDPGFPL